MKPESGRRDWFAADFQQALVSVGFAGKGDPGPCSCGGLYCMICQHSFPDLLSLLVIILILTLRMRSARTKEQKRKRRQKYLT